MKNAWTSPGSCVSGSWLNLLRAFQPACRQLQQLRNGLDVPVRLVHVDMPEVGGQFGNFPFDVDPRRYQLRSVQTANRCRMSCSLGPWP